MNWLKKEYILFIFLMIFGFLFVINYPSMTHNVFMVVNRFGIIDTPYKELVHSFILFIVITIFFIIFSSNLYTKLWLIKAFVTLVVMLGYEANYGIDAYMYFGEAVHKFYRYVQPHSTSGTYHVVLINRFFTYIVGDSYHALKLLNSFIAFLGLILLYKTYEKIMKNNNVEIDNYFIYFFFLFPTILFWSSILGKDPLNLFFIGLFSYGFIHLIDEFKVKYFLIIVLSIWLVSYIRSWWSIIMITSIFFYYLKINSARNFFLFILIMPIFTVFAMQFLQTQGITSIDQMFLKMSDTSSKLAYGGSSVGVHIITGFGDYLLWFFPNLFTTLFRPMPWDIRNAFTLLAAVENVMLFYLTYKYIFKNWNLIYANKYLKFYILLILSWSLLYVIISPTNLGMAARFKLQVLPLMLILIGVSKNILKNKNKL